MSLIRPAKVVRCELLGRVVLEVVYEPAVAERTESNKGHAQSLGGVDESVGLMVRLESGVFGLDGIYLGNYEGF